MDARGDHLVSDILWLWDPFPTVRYLHSRRKVSPLLSVLTATACGGLPWPRSRRELAADIRAFGFTFGSFVMLTSTAIASSVCIRASAARFSSRLGRPDGLPDCPGTNRPVSALLAGKLLLLVVVISPIEGPCSTVLLFGIGLLNFHWIG